MVIDLPTRFKNNDAERSAYNAVFCELEFSWFWDPDTYLQLVNHSANAVERIRHYLETSQPHLLRAYDAGFLALLIENKKLDFERSRAYADRMAYEYLGDHRFSAVPCAPEPCASLKSEIHVTSQACAK